MDVSKYKSLYLQETGEHLSGIEAGLLALEKGPADSSVLDTLFRHYHSIKGMSASMGYEPMMRLAHAQEDLLDRLRSGKLPFSDAIISALLSCLDAMKALIGKVRADEPLEADLPGLLDALKAAAEGRAAPGPAAEAVEQALRLSSTMKVEGRLFDDLLASVGDLFMLLSSFRGLAHGSRAVELKNGVHQLGRSVNGLHETIMDARMLPIEDIAAGLPRVVRDISKETGKEVALVTEGMDMRLDRSILEGLGSPLVHIIRNAVDHGVETAEQRRAAGKDAAATIAVRAYAKRGRIVIEVTDDGQGMDREKLKARALSRGVAKERLSAMTDSEVLKLVCMPGLSTADSVTTTSGRGVGMDVVKGAVEGFGGTLEIESTPGKGTRIVMEMPRTTSITKALIVEASGELFLIPISRIEKVVELDSGELEGATYGFDGADIPLVSLSAALGMEDGPRRHRTLVVVDASAAAAGVGGKSLAGLVVDDFADEIDAYIKPLVPPMSRLGGTIGITILGDGRPVFLLDIPQVILKALAGA